MNILRASAGIVAAGIFSVATARVAVSVPATTPSWSPTYQLNASTFVYTCNYTGLSDVSPTSILARFGLVAFDWSESKEVWAKDAPMTCEETLVRHAAALKRSRPDTRVLLYRNVVKALPWMLTPRVALERPDAPACGLFHDQVQTPHYPNNSKYDGTCARPCVCGSDGLPCGEYLWDHRNPAVRDFIVREYMLGATGLGSAVVDGFSLDDGWSNRTQAGSNACDGSPVGGPSEVDSFCAADMGLGQADTDALTAGWAGTVAAVAAAVNERGGFLWNQFVTVATPPPGNASQCAAFFRDACGEGGRFFGAPVLHAYSEGAGRVFDPLPAFTQDLAAFLLLRGPHAWLGYNWNGCSFGAQPPGGRNGQKWSFPPELDVDVGEPRGPCAEAAPAGASGVFTRAWTRADVSFDCNSWTGRVAPSVAPP